jgi:hypothetical protein
MNAAQKQAIETHISFLQDNLYRFRMQQKANPNYVTGNGEPIADIIANHEKQIAELLADD